MPGHLGAPPLISNGARSDMRNSPLFPKREEDPGEGSGHIGLADACSVGRIRQDHAGVRGGS